MINRMKKPWIMALLSSAAVVIGVPESQAQILPNPYFQIRPGLSLQQAAYNVAVMGQALQNVPSRYSRFNGGPGAASLMSYGNPYINPYASLYSNPYGYGGYGGYPYDPYGAALMGSAQVITSQGKFMESQQQAFLMREKVHSERIANRRKMFDEYLYEREHTPTLEEERQRTLREQVERSRNNPPLTEVYSGKSLNDLLADLRKNIGRQDNATLRTFSLPLDEAGLKHVNVSKGTGNIALLKNDGRLNWPVALSGPEFKEVRDQVDSLANDALRQAGFGNPVDAGTVKQLINDTNQLRQDLRRTGGDLTPSMYIEASTFLNNLDDAIRALQQPDISNYVNGKYVLKAKSVPDLVKFMTDNGLQFAPAVPGDENAYMALHSALAAYDRAAQVQTAGR